MKNATYFLTCLIVISVCSAANAGRLVAQTSASNQFQPFTDSSIQKTLSPSFSIDIIEDESKGKFILAIDNPLGEKIFIHISSHSGTGYVETISQTQFRKRFDLSGADDGNYLVAVSNGKKTIRKKIQLSTQVVRAIEIY